jgi:glycine/D-amino acid oxidase-like deaminating enzyme
MPDKYAHDDQVLGIEQFTVAHDKGSSHGLSRIIRLQYHEHPDYVPLLRRAYDLWASLEQETNIVCFGAPLMSCTKLCQQVLFKA